GVEHIGQAVLRIHRGAPDEEPCRLDLHLHFGEAQLHSLKVDQGLAELLALLDIGNDVLERAARLRKSHGGIATALEIEGFHQLAKPPGGHDDMVQRQLASIEIQVAARYAAETHEAFRAAITQARCPFLDIDSPDAFRARVIAHATVDDITVSVAA